MIEAIKQNSAYWQSYDVLKVGLPRELGASEVTIHGDPIEICFTATKQYINYISVSMLTVCWEQMIHIK